jgi:hypothetical protein
MDSTTYSYTGKPISPAQIEMDKGIRSDEFFMVMLGDDWRKDNPPPI